MSWSPNDHIRHVMYDSIWRVLANQPWPAAERAGLELGADHRSPVWDMLGQLSGGWAVTLTNYPETDIHDVHLPDNAYDAVVCEQVFEHIERPWIAADEIWRLTRPGGLAVVDTPCLFQMHRIPIDAFRLMPDAYRVLFPAERWDWLTLATWGSRSALAFELGRANGFNRLPVDAAPGGYFESEPDFPMLVWWVGRKR